MTYFNILEHIITYYNHQQALEHIRTINHRHYRGQAGQWRHIFQAKPAAAR